MPYERVPFVLSSFMLGVIKYVGESSSALLAVEDFAVSSGDAVVPTVLKSASKNAAAGKKIAVVKESYGNAFVPYLTNNYEEVHVIDFRYFKHNLVDYCKTNGIDEVLFMNGVMSANTQVQLDSMSGLFN